MRVKGGYLRLGVYRENWELGTHRGTGLTCEGNLFGLLGERTLLKVSNSGAEIHLVKLRGEDSLRGSPLP